MSVNVSARQLEDHGLRDEVEVALAESLLEPSALILEVTESATIGDTDAMTARLMELHDLGVQLAIDDFGTGYSSLSRLRRFPLDILKVDRSFVSGMIESPADAAIVASVVGLGQNLGLRVVAEGVETVAQLEHLANLGCDYGQGFNWAFPAAPRDLRAWLGMVLAPHESRPASQVGVLIVDDLAPLRAAVRIAIEADDRFVVLGEAADAAAAIAAAARLQPQVIVLDVAMPGMGGLQAVPHLRDAAPGAAIVLLTAIDLAYIDPALAASADACFDKARDLTSLVHDLGAVVGLAA
jgi:CheY-like chemotaxis protein